jgi:hypothetical protein
MIPSLRNKSFINNPRKVLLHMLLRKIRLCYTFSDIITGVIFLIQNRPIIIVVINHHASNKGKPILHYQYPSS